jgi:hypothetical protein
MSDWIGPNVYRIENHKDRKAAVTVNNDGNAKDKQVIIKYDTATKPYINTM